MYIVHHILYNAHCTFYNVHLYEINYTKIKCYSIYYKSIEIIQLLISCIYTLLLLLFLLLYCSYKLQ